uniref:Auxin response factor n=1 Tax=Gossypium raimondii TaxID=29730 RepID=A0A0D2R8J4_GOSRA|nr:hypothetical protein B456_010G157400 [Gossypium raimondii]
MGGLIDLNSTEDDETPLSGSLSPSSSSASVLSAPGSGSSVCLELWHACAGPLISLPKRGNVVVYFPQGHLEQVSDFSGVAAAYDLPSHVFCRVVDVKLHAEGATDEVYAQVSLVPETEQSEQKLEGGKTEADGEEEDAETNIKSTTPHMFCKTLTASDTSTHGGFSVPRRAAEDCFPPLDYNQQRPSQELVAKDLHGSEWRFRHIYRGQPRRHLLTSGWSAFVNKKKLVSGDAVLFLRGEDGELRLGVRRAAQIKDGSSFPSSCSQQLNCSNFADVVHAVSMKSVFSIYYNPRASSSDFVIPVHKFWKCLDPSFSIGMRFKMQFEAEDAAERRHSGVITGISDINPVRWPGSKWRCLMVRWNDIDANRHGRVSPWEIEPSGSVSGSNSLISPGSKRNRVGFPSGNSEFMVPDGIRASDFGEFLWSQLSGTRSGWSSLMQRYNTHSRTRPFAPSTQTSSPSSVLTFLQGKLFPSSASEHDSRARDLGSSDLFGHSIGSVQLGDASPLAAQPVFRTSQELDSSCKSSCRLFGFSLTEGRHDASKEEDVVQATSSLAAGAFLPCVREEFHPKPSSVTDTVGSNYTEASNLYSVRDMVLDIAL